MLRKQNKQTAPKSTQKRKSNTTQGIQQGSLRTAPLALSRRIVAPQVQKRILARREFLTTVSGSTTFSANSFSINPALSSFAIFGAAEARLYESYRCRKLRFDFVPQKGADKDGILYMAIDYDAADSAPSNLADMSTMGGFEGDRIWCESSLGSGRIDNAKMVTERYTRTAGLASNLDIKTYDIGNLVVATDGCADTSTIGNIFVEYEFELLTPQPSTVDSQGFTGVSGTTQTSWLGTTPTSVGVGLFTATVNTLTCVTPGEYVIAWSLRTATSVSNGAVTGTATIDETPMGAGTAFLGGSSTGTFAKVITVKATKGQTVIIGETGTGTWSSSLVMITQCRKSVFD